MLYQIRKLSYEQQNNITGHTTALIKLVTVRLVVLESGLGLESGLESVLRGLGLGLGLELEGLGLGLGLDDSGLDLLSSPYGSPAKKIAEHYKHCSNNHAISAAYQSPGYFTYLLKQWFALVSYSLYSVTTTMAEARIIKFAYCNVVIKDNCVTAQCVFCKTKTTISEKLGTTSNFVRHVQRKHPEK